jgi:hypothetical protein
MTSAVMRDMYDYSGFFFSLGFTYSDIVSDTSVAAITSDLLRRGESGFIMNESGRKTRTNQHIVQKLIDGEIDTVYTCGRIGKLLPVESIFEYAEKEEILKSLYTLGVLYTYKMYEQEMLDIARQYAHKGVDEVNRMRSDKLWYYVSKCKCDSLGFIQTESIKYNGAVICIDKNPCGLKGDTDKLEESTIISRLKELNISKIVVFDRYENDGKYYCLSYCGYDDTVKIYDRDKDIELKQSVYWCYRNKDKFRTDIKEVEDGLYLECLSGNIRLDKVDMQSSEQHYLENESSLNRLNAKLKLRGDVEFDIDGTGAIKDIKFSGNEIKIPVSDKVRSISTGCIKLHNKVTSDTLKIIIGNNIKNISNNMIEKTNYAGCTRDLEIEFNGDDDKTQSKLIKYAVNYNSKNGRTIHLIFNRVKTLKGLEYINSLVSGEPKVMLDFGENAFDDCKVTEQELINFIKGNNINGVIHDRQNGKMCLLREYGKTKYVTSDDYVHCQSEIMFYKYIAKRLGMAEKSSVIKAINNKEKTYVYLYDNLARMENIYAETVSKKELMNYLWHFSQNMENLRIPLNKVKLKFSTNMSGWECVEKYGSCMLVGNSSDSRHKVGTSCMQLCLEINIDDTISNLEKLGLKIYSYWRINDVFLRKDEAYKESHYTFDNKIECGIPIMLGSGEDLDVDETLFGGLSVDRKYSIWDIVYKARKKETIKLKDCMGYVFEVQLL